MVFETEAEVGFAEGDPEAFTGPADVDQFLAVGEEGAEEGGECGECGFGD